MVKKISLAARKNAIIAKARKRDGKISPTCKNRSLDDCFTSSPSGALVLWYNTPSHTTHVVREELV